jgi:hypothetical protein
MYRASLVAIASLFLSAALVAQEAQSELEAFALKITINAYQVGDYDTVETLFHKLSLENKKMFLQVAIVMSEVVFGKDIDMLPQTFVDVAFTVVTNTEREPKPKMEDMPAVLMQWAEIKKRQTQLLGRLTLSLFEPSAKERKSGGLTPPHESKPIYSKKKFAPKSGGVSPPLMQRPESEQRILKLLEMPITFSGSADPVTLAQALHAFCGPHNMAMFVDEAGLREAGISSDVMVHIPPISEVKLSGVLNMLLDQHGLAYVVKNEMLTITTKKKAKGATVTRTYYIGDMITGYVGDTGIQHLADIVTAVVEPDSWKEDYYATIAVHAATKSLAIRQTEDVHTQIEDLFTQIRWMNDEAHVKNMGTLKREMNVDVQRNMYVPPPSQYAPYQTHGGIVAPQLQDAVVYPPALPQRTKAAPSVVERIAKPDTREFVIIKEDEESWIIAPTHHFYRMSNPRTRGAW